VGINDMKNKPIKVFLFVILYFVFTGGLNYILNGMPENYEIMWFIYPGIALAGVCIVILGLISVIGTMIALESI
jgi:hypothetical protein